VPVIHSDRYSLALAAFYLTFAAAALASPRLGVTVRGLGVPLKWVVALWPVVLMVSANVEYHRRLLGQLPVELISIGRALRETAPPGSRIMARKPHIAYYSGMSAAPFPNVSALPDLADSCRRYGAGYLFVSWPEVQTRPAFYYLLDTAAVLPGLEVVRATARHPAVAYRLTPAFGTLPPWFANDTLRRVHSSRAQLMVNASDWRAHLSLGMWERKNDRFEKALEHFQAVNRYQPGSADGWLLTGETQLNLGRLQPAYEAYSRALALNPRSVDARVGLGWVQLQGGLPQAAAELWRPAVDAVEDPTTLRAMVELFTRLGDAQGAQRAREALARRTR
jgi:hypothetical protein